MVLLQRIVVVALAGSAAFAFRACGNQHVMIAFPPPAAGSPASITLAADGSGACMQNGIEAGNGAIVDRTQGVTWYPPPGSNYTLKITLPQTCGFANGCTLTAATPGGSVSSGASSVGANTVVPYSHISFDGGTTQDSCTLNGVNHDGLIMK